MQNTYQIKNSNCSSSAIALTVNDKSVTVTFLNRRRNGLLIYDTDNENIQLAIEASPRFKSGEITRTVGESPVVVGKSADQVIKLPKLPKAVSEEAPRPLGTPREGNVGDSGDKADDVPAEEAPRLTGTPREGNVGDGETLPVDELPVVPAEEVPGAATAFLEVTEWQAAKEILRNEPYNVPFQGLNKPENILKKAAEVGVVFPNLVK